MKTLVLAEKPSVGRELSRILGCAPKGKGYAEGQKHVVTWALGHLVTLAEPDDYDAKYRTWRLEDLPMLPETMKLKVIRESSNQFRVVAGLMKRDDLGELVIATDAGREGELVARWIMKLAGWRKPFKRLWISSQTDQAVKEGFAKLKPGQAYDNLFHAARCRSEADWLIGLNVTRALTCKHDAQLTAGRVQTPTLAMICAREREIAAFVPRDFWTVNADFGDYRGRWRDADGNGRLFSRTGAEEIVAKAQGHPGVVVAVDSKSKTEPPPLAYDLTELQRDANRLHGWSAKKTLQTLQGLYENHKIVTYPRTDSRYITTDLVPTLPARLKAASFGPWAGFIKPLLDKPLKAGPRLVNDARVGDHHAILPTEQAPDLKRLGTDERTLYDLVVKRFVTVLHPPCLYDQLTLTTRVNGEDFFTRGKAMRDPGWRAVTSRVAADEAGDKDDLPDQPLKAQKKGEPKPVKTVRLEKGQTVPPPRYTEATLLTAMESPGKFIEDEELREAVKEGGLGTPATRAEIIEKLIGYGYVERQGSHLVPQSKGMQAVELAPEVLRSPELTAQWELRLSKIAKGQERPEAFLADIRKNAGELVESVKAATATYREDNLTKVKCPMCGKFMVKVSGRGEAMLRCQDRSCGHSRPEKAGGFMDRRVSPKERAREKHLARQFSDSQQATTSLGDLLKKALDKKG
ncbi:MAG TPA: DNA topoisomerase III [Syntrophus sp. (in: bacteria)]|nr:DNA topoisomerase III [Syntrophus sp. (in: bacteria)]